MILDSALEFPPVDQTDEDGLLAVGGDLSVERLLLAYKSGIFPWFSNPLGWFSPEERAIFDLEKIMPSSRLARKMKTGTYTFTINKAFERVMRECAKSRPHPHRQESWISEEFIEGYTKLYYKGYAHSVECWQDKELIGGIYGVAIGGFFGGESMFYNVSDGGKMAFYHLIDHLRKQGFVLFDSQALNSTTEKLGAFNIPREDYLKQLKQAVNLKISFL
jgi:leucyl/phenylalanyl-tRNA--protein transferase